MDEEILKAMKADGVDTENHMERLLWMKKQKEENDRLLYQLRYQIDRAEKEIRSPVFLEIAVKKKMASLPDTPAEALAVVIKDLVLTKANVDILTARVAILERRPERVLHYLGITKEKMDEELAKAAEKEDGDGKKNDGA